MNNKPAYRFSSSFANHIVAFIEMKRSVGYKYIGEEGTLKRLDKFLVAEKYHGKGLSRKIIEKWLSRKNHESRRSQLHRVSMVRQLTNYLLERNIPAYYPANIPVTCPKDHFVPYIFTHRQIGNLFKAADAIAKRKRPGGLAALFPIIVRLLYSTGTRIGELLRLRWRDIDVEKGVVKIREGKFRKDRLLPLSPQMLNIVRKYANQYNQRQADDIVFQNPCGKECNNRSIYTWFRKALFDAGIPHGGRGKGPRIHDLRHTFAVHNLERWIKEKQDLQVNLAILVDYLGHETMSGTGQYLRLVPSIYPEIVARMENSIGRKVKRYRNETD
jgi:integrase